MNKDITLGQYYPSNSFVHKLDPRMKLILLILHIVVIFSANTLPACIFAALPVLFAVALSKLPLRLYFGSLKAIWFLVIFTALLNMFYYEGRVLLTIGPLSITFEGIRQSCIIALRLVCLIMVSSTLTFTATPTELTGAIESLLSPLKLLHVPVHELAMLMTIALRFVPTLLEEAEKIMSAQKSRGADLESGGVLQRIKALIPILIPLFVSAFRRAYDLALAMECRCYTDGKGRTHLNEMKLRFRDFFALLLMLAAAAGIFMLNRAPHWSLLLAAAGEYCGMLISYIKEGFDSLAEKYLFFIQR